MTTHHDRPDDHAESAAETAAHADAQAAHVQATDESGTPTANPAENPEAQTPDPIAAMQAEIQQWRDLALRAQADFDNYRKRSAREIGEIRRFAAGELLSDLLPVLDNFDLGLMAARNESANSAIALGMSMVRRQLDDFLVAQGVKEIPADGLAFDPTKHDAVATEAHDTIPDGMIIRIARKGYFLHDRVLRAPSVIVSSGPAAETHEAAE